MTKAKRKRVPSVSEEEPRRGLRSSARQANAEAAAGGEEAERGRAAKARAAEAAPEVSAPHNAVLALQGMLAAARGPEPGGGGVRFKPISGGVGVWG